MNLKIRATNLFKKSSRLMARRGCNNDDIRKVIDMLMHGKTLPEKYKDHLLTGNFKGYRECHIKPDWLLVYRIEGDTLILYDTGTHSDLFG